ncbi:hypothetical protein [Oceanithermus desulfurans]|uniref:Uncharacterized protein n=2 Tax=Oceanithermus desulfurans TaxID=227924 RepID=A0A511RIS0_9DEIN|nr:hypothetical protein [Oceanithermus desulfurans]MBB6029755.1 hypothetical protein [Oceanithermus desulfurans]GEM89548.1 hypothetical protein ODE01S_09820 [Oceanithermus desulfurans NBRC 100063]
MGKEARKRIQIRPEDYTVTSDGKVLIHNEELAKHIAESLSAAESGIENAEPASMDFLCPIVL